MFSYKLCLTQDVLEGRKTMTRRIIEAPKTWHGFEVYGFCINKNYLGNVKDISLVGADGGSIEDENGSLGMILPKYKIGEVVAVAQSYKEIASYPYFISQCAANEQSVNDMMLEKGWNNKMFVAAYYMPHHIRITDIKVERLQDISDEDCLKEGIIASKEYTNLYWLPDKIDGKLSVNYSTPQEAFASLIDKVSGKGTWEKNPYCFCYEFKLIK